MPADPHIELYKATDGDWYFRLIAANNEEITRSSEGYENRADAIAAILLAHGNGIVIKVEGGEPLIGIEDPIPGQETIDA